MKHAKNGLPQGNKCLKKFSGWPAFMSHFNQRACAVLHLALEAGHSESADPPACGALVPRGGQPSAATEISFPASVHEKHCKPGFSLHHTCECTVGQTGALNVECSASQCISHGMLANNMPGSRRQTLKW